MRRTILLATTAALLSGALVVPAIAVTPAGPGTRAFEAIGSITIASVLDETGVLPAIVNGVTLTDFLSQCAVPSTTQGFDGYVVELPTRMRNVEATAELQSSPGGSLIRDTYMEFYDAGCAKTGHAGWYSEDDSGQFKAGTRYIFISASKGAQISFTLKAEAIR